MRSDPSIIIAGGGWAGLAAAVELSANGVPATLFELSRYLGGRARRLDLGPLAVDNGQHLFIGAYREMLRLLRLMGVEENELFLRERLSLRMLDGEDLVQLRAPVLPAPLHLAYALATAKGLSLAERGNALLLALRLSLAGFEIPIDKSVAALLTENGQPARLVERLWAPICLATLNVGPEQASARVFLHVLRDAFSKKRSDSDLLFQRVDLGQLFPEPALRFIEKQGGKVHLSNRVTGLYFDQKRVAGVMTEQGEVKASSVVLALPARIAADLLEPCEATRSIAHDLCMMEHTPIATVYLRYDPHVQLENPMLGLLGTTSQWVFDRRFTGQAGVMAVVISGSGAHMEMGKSQLGQCVAEELGRRFGWPSPHEIQVVREKRATFLCDAGIDARRPEARLPAPGLFLAGDYTATGYPATLEGAVRSGVQCARLILGDLAIQTAEKPS